MRNLGVNLDGLWIPIYGAPLSGERLSSKLVAQACLRAAETAGNMAVILRRGDPDSGALFVKALARDRQARLFGQTIDYDGSAAWRSLTGGAPAQETDIDARLAREAKIDPDIWVIEVLDDALEHPLRPKLV